MELDEDTRDHATAASGAGAPRPDAPQVPGYRVMAQVGRGSTATVWRARRVSDDSLVALKVLHAEADEQALREHAVLQSDAGEHVVRVHDCVAGQGEGGPVTVLVLDWMAGGSLSDVMAGRGFLNAGETVTVVAPLATALGRLHRIGVVHGDVAPGNVLLDSTGRPVWGDLGYARLVGFDRAAEDAWGTDGFVAPEVLLGREPSAASDVYGLGALAWFCLTGKPPGHVTTRGDLDQLAPGAPAGLVEVIRSCLDPDPAARPDAEPLATDVFDAAPAVPLRMTVPEDIATSLTRRIRSAAEQERSELEEPPVWELDLGDPPRRRWPWQRRRDDESVEVASEGRRGTRAPRRKAAHAAPAERAGRPWLAPVTLVCIVGLVLAVLVPWERLAQASPGGEGVAATVEPAVEAVAAAPSVDETLLADRQAPRRDPRATTQALASLRARMLLERDRQLLEDLAERDSSARRADAAVLRELADSGSSYEGLRFTVASAEVVRTDGADSVVVRAAIDQSAYVVEDGDGDGTPHPAVEGEPLDLELVFDDRWRIATITRP
ncbi:hypothetical protein GCM10022199_17050 [Marihabitans asiaticum]|nr:serine/threonine-protein kinase [Marihabitans asiaticum]